MKKAEKFLILSAVCICLGFTTMGCSSQDTGNADNPLSGDSVIITPSENAADQSDVGDRKSVV